MGLGPACVDGVADPAGSVALGELLQPVKPGAMSSAPDQVGVAVVVDVEDEDGDAAIAVELEIGVPVPGSVASILRCFEPSASRDNVAPPVAVNVAEPDAVSRRLDGQVVADPAKRRAVSRLGAAS